MPNGINENPQPTTDWLTGGGQMGELTRHFDWSQTTLGPTAEWPQGLKIAISLMLASRYPMLIWWGPELIHFYNDAYVPVLGKRHPAALGRSARTVWAEAWPTIGSQVDRVMQQGISTWNEELPILMTRNGYPEEVYMTFSYSPIRDDTGAVAGLFCACTEDTQQVLGRRRLRTLRALAEASAHAKSVTEACQMAAVAVGDNRGDLPFALFYRLDTLGQKATLVGLTGLPSGLPASPVVIDLRQPAAFWPLGQVAQMGQALEVDPLPEAVWPETNRESHEPIRRALVLPIIQAGQEGRLAGFLVAGINPLRPLDEDYRGFMALLAAQTATAIGNAHAYEEEHRRAEALAEIDRTKTAFFTNVSHEFRTPLTLMLGPLTEVLTDNTLPPTTHERVSVAYRNSQRLLKLDNTLLDFARIEAGRIEASYEEVDLAALTTELASVFRSAIEQAGMAFIVDCQPLPEAVYVDRELWEKIVLNLLSNAFKFTFAGEIRISLRSTGEGAELSVRDTGTGIPADELPHLYKRFHRVKGARGRSYEGSGIGLALVSELVKLHGGQLSVQSEVDQGSTFKVVIPFGKTHLPVDRLARNYGLPSTGLRAESYVEESVQWLPPDPIYLLPEGGEPTISTAGSEPVAADSKQGSWVLLVDDNADMREYVRRLLAVHWNVVTVADGTAALSALQRQRFDLVLTDVMMPKLDGFGLLKAIRADEHTRSLPVILLSARAGEEARVEGLKAGADDYLIKPFSARELVAHVESQLKLQGLRRQLEEVLREADRRKDEFLAMLAHELRNPLAPIRHAVQLLQLTAETNETMDAALALMSRQINHLVRLVDDLLDVGRISQGKIVLQRSQLELSTLVNQAVEAVRPIYERGHRLLSVQVPSLPIYMDGDVTRLTQVVTNLLTNGARYTEEGGQVWVTLEQVDDPLLGSEAVLRVRDDGIGLATDQLTTIFDLFMQVDTSLARSQGGLGLGLTLVKRLVELHGGRVEVQSPGVGQGSEFLVYLPILPAVNSPIPKASPQTSPQVLEHRILVVDDNVDAATTLAMLLKLKKYEVHTCYSGRQALEAGEHLRPTVILLDIGMPDLDGYEVCRLIRQQPWGLDVGLIALTGYGQAEVIRRSQEAGFNGHLVKPVDMAALIQLLITLPDLTQRNPGSG